jgi:predicted PurR-regulated permease PerM
VQLSVPSEPRNRLQSIGLAVTGLGAAIALLYYGRAFCITVVISVILAFMLEPFVGIFMRARMPRGLASFLVCTIALLILYLLGLGLFTELASLADDLPAYSQRVNELVDAVADRIERVERNAYRLVVPKRFQEKGQVEPEAPPVSPRKTRRREAAPPPQPAVQEIRIQQERASLLDYAAGYVTSVYQSLLMVSFVPFLVYFMLSWRDHLRRTALALYQGGDRRTADKSWRAIGEMARAFVVGNVILGLIISLASCLVFWLWSLPYWILIGFISGFLSLIPYIGLPLALIPALAAALMTYYTVTPFVIISMEVAAIHLLALNLLYPAIVGSRVHLNPLVVTIALMFWGTIWGGIGLILAIPITAAIKAFFDNTEGLQPYGRLMGD